MTDPIALFVHWPGRGCGQRGLRGEGPWVPPASPPPPGSPTREGPRPAREKGFWGAEPGSAVRAGYTCRAAAEKALLGLRKGFCGGGGAVGLYL